MAFSQQVLSVALALTGGGEFSSLRRNPAWVVALACGLALFLVVACVRLFEGNRRLLLSLSESPPTLPDEIVLRFFSFMPIHDIGRASQVCKQWRRVSRDEDLWLDFCLRDFRPELASRVSSAALPAPDSSYYDFYKTRFAEASGWSLAELQHLAGTPITEYLPHSVVLASAPLLLAGIVAIFLHWFSTDIDIDWASLARGWHPQDIWEFVFGIVFMIALAVFWHFILPLVQFVLHAAVEPAFLFLGHHFFEVHLGEAFGISLSDHKTLAVLLGASFVSFLLVTAIFFLLVLNLSVRLNEHLRSKRLRKLKMLRETVLQPKWLR